MNLDMEDQTDLKLHSRESSEMILAKRLEWYSKIDTLHLENIKTNQAQRIESTSDTQMLSSKLMILLKLKTLLTYSKRRKMSISLRDSKISTLRLIINGAEIDLKILKLKHLKKRISNNNITNSLF